MLRDSILSTGSVELMIEDPKYAADSCPAPVLQCLMVKPITPMSTNVRRWRAVLSDGRNWIQTMLISALGHLAENGDLVKGCICRLKQCMPYTIKGKVILVIQTMEIIRSFGIVHKIGPPVPLPVDLQLRLQPDGGVMITFSVEKQQVFPSWRLLSGFPLEILHLIVANLSYPDKLALSLASKELRALIRPSLYSVVGLGGKKHLAHFVETLAREPEIRSSVRTCVLDGDVCCVDPETCDSSIDSITNLPLLRHLCFRPDSEIISHCSIVSMLQRLVSQKTLQSLRSFYIDLNCRYAYDLPSDLQEKLLRMMFSAPHIRDLQVSYCHRDHGDFPNRSIREITNLRPIGVGAKSTDVRNLGLQWDGLPLSLLSALLRAPRNLEALTLRISGRYDHAPWDSAMTLESALSPIAGSVQELEVDFVHRVDGNRPEALGLLWGNRGLTAFTRLQSLSISGEFLSEVQGFDGKTPWFPPSLVSLCITTCELSHCSKPEPIAESNPTCPRLSRGEHFICFDPATVRVLSSLSRLLEPAPNFSQFLIKEKSHGYGAYQREYLRQYPPIVLVGEDLVPLVYRGLRVGLEITGAANVWLDVKVVSGL